MDLFRNFCYFFSLKVKTDHELIAVALIVCIDILLMIVKEFVLIFHFVFEVCKRSPRCFVTLLSIEPPLSYRFTFGSVGNKNLPDMDKVATV
ncbi:hypothetical protein RIF29_21756 [Crotalaria pallida]|uniref:Uncharacterized protein n=1 Tax=Crotalaria pallida TaxID=3830 RepID=A0AAN9F7D6_CROPI